MRPIKSQATKARLRFSLTPMLWKTKISNSGHARLWQKSTIIWPTPRHCGTKCRRSEFRLNNRNVTRNRRVYHAVNTRPLFIMEEKFMSSISATDHLLDWLRDAHAMEQQAEKMLQGMAQRLEHYDELR